MAGFWAVRHLKGNGRNAGRPFVSAAASSEAEPRDSAARGALFRRRAGAFAGVLILLAAFLGMSCWEMVGDSATSDEVTHLPSGYAYWKERAFHLNPDHPPFLKLLSAVPLLFMDLPLPPLSPPAALAQSLATPRVAKWTEEYQVYKAYQGIFGAMFLTHAPGPETLLFWGRLPCLLLGLLLAVLVFLWSLELHGSLGAAFVSLFLVTFSPSMIAHSHYINTDIGVTGFGVMALFFLWRFSRRGRTRDLCLAALGLGLAMATKYSAIVLLPIFLLLLLVRWPETRPRDQGAAVRLRHRAVACVLVLVICVLVIEACYLFSSDWTLYWKGIQAVLNNRLGDDYLSYAGGRFHEGGVWWYLPYAVMLKIPLVSLIVVALGLFALVSARRKDRDWLGFVLLPAAAWVAVMCTLSDNLGIRYLLPAMGLLYVAAGGAYSLFARTTWSRIAGGALALWLTVSVLRVGPHFLSYFNEALGGPENAPQYLADSNVDWGQDFNRLLDYLKRSGMDDIVLSYWGPISPEYYALREHMKFRPLTYDMLAGPIPPPGVYAISVNHLVMLRRPGQPPAYDWLSRFTPKARIGYSIYLYEFGAEGTAP